MTTRTTATAVPLARLLAMAFRLLIDGLHERLAERGWRDLRPAFGFVLLGLRGGPATLRELTELLGTSKQAVSKLVEAMVETGYVKRRTHPDDARAKTVQLTQRGHRLLAAVEEIYDELERQWADVIGRERIEGIREDLDAVLRSAYGEALPAVRPLGPEA
ncbi:MAG: MarR family transcriptional regulator [Pseudonocardiales bacterium]|nr:MarR family transcriptional regulator [Pseudonocardiales bacterium]